MPTRTVTLGDVVALLERLVAFDTESHRSNLSLVEAVAAHCRAEGVPFSVVPNSDGTKAAIMATVGPMVDGGLVLSGHTDVVPVAGQAWLGDPYKLRQDGSRLHGRGACDMKGFDALALAMIPEIKAANLPVPVHILLSYDEEVTCLGAVDMITRFGTEFPRPHSVIVGEPTMLQVADAHKSVCTYETRVIGRAAHSAKPACGADAIAAACEIVCELTRLGRHFEQEGDTTGRFDPAHSTIHAGLIRGGNARNILAASCDLSWEFRGLPGLSLDTARRHLERFVATTALPKLNRYGVWGSISTAVEIEVPGLEEETGSPAELLCLRAAQLDRTIAVPYATEAGRFQAAGLPTVVCGPGNIDQAHQPDEYIEVDQLGSGLEFMRRLIASLRWREC